MSPSRRSAFRASALLSELVTQQQLDEAVAALRLQPTGQPLPAAEVTDDELAGMLIQMGLLSAYQVDQLHAGRTKLRLGPYLVVDWIGQGGMGQVFKAVHRIMGREVAVKVLPMTKSTPEAISSFTREIRTQAQLDHPNLVRAFDAGRDGNVYYLVTEFVPGTDLRRLLRSQGMLTMHQAATIFTQAARGLKYAHKQGLIHRDVKPGNMLVSPDGHTKVSDLGLAGYVHEAHLNPRAGRTVGTADYLSPEQIRSPRDVTPASDIYSLGCTLYYAVTRKVPFAGGTTRNKARRHCEETPWHPRRFNPDLSEEFVELIADMMEKDVSRRIQSAGEVAARLEPWATYTGPMPAQQMTKSPWMPLPTDPELDDEELNDTDSGSWDFDAEEFQRQEESHSHGSQGTDPVTSAVHDTRPMQRGSERLAPPPVPTSDPPPSSAKAMAIVLAIAIPISIIIGGLTTFALLSLLK